MPDVESDVPDCRSIGFGLRFFLNRRVESGSLSRSVGRLAVAVPAGALRAHLTNRQLPCPSGSLTLPEGARGIRGRALSVVPSVGRPLDRWPPSRAPRTGFRRTARTVPRRRRRGVTAARCRSTCRTRCPPAPRTRGRNRTCPAGHREARRGRRQGCIRGVPGRPVPTGRLRQQGCGADASRTPDGRQPAACSPSPGRTSRSRQVSRAVHTRLSASSVMTISYVAVDRPRCTGVATPVTRPERTPR